MPAAVRRDRIRVRVCLPDDEPGPCSDGAGPAPEVRDCREGLTVCRHLDVQMASGKRLLVRNAQNCFGHQ